MSEFAHQFGINWKLLLAQAVNFFILFWILKRFVYGPVLNMLEKRRKEIKEGLEAAEASQKRLAEADIEKQAILTKANQESLGIVSQSEIKAKEREKEILEETHKKAEAVVLEAKQKIREEKLKTEEEILRESRGLLKEAVAKIIEKSPESIDDMLIKNTLAELKNIS
ncbi:MAG: F0F1 ATP synthase subunit B [bacterium]|nr:F0F1 ATP synthase subunit B [bacterium]